MAAASEGFSIREYALKMRSLDVARCWPFSEEIGQESSECLLPPITVVKFRWWSHELGVLRGNVKASEDNKPEKRRAKAKSRAPKKRSIVEIFAAAPQIQTVNDYGDGEREGDCCKRRREGLERTCARYSFYGESDKKSMKWKKKKQKKKIGKREKLAVANMLMKKKETKESRAGGLKKTVKGRPTGKKVSKRKMQTQASARKSDGSLCKWHMADDISHMSSISKKRGSLQSLSARKDKAAQSSKLSTKERQSPLPVRSILKNNGEIRPSQDVSNCSSKNSDKTNYTGVRHDRHVRFSDHNDTIDERKKNICAFEQRASSFYSDTPLSSGCSWSAVNGRELLTTLVGRSVDDVSRDSSKGNRVQLLAAEEKLPPISEGVNVLHCLKPHLSYQERLKCFPDKPALQCQAGIHYYDSNLDDKSDRTVSFSDVYSCHPGQISLTEEAKNRSITSETHPSLPSLLNLSSKLADCHEENVYGIAATSSDRKMQLLSHPQLMLSPRTSNEVSNSRGHFSSHSPPANISLHAPPNRSVYYQPCMKPVSSLYFPEWEKKVVPTRERPIGNEFMGLPLNSQGELVAANSIYFGSLDHSGYSSIKKGSSGWLTVQNRSSSTSQSVLSNLKEKQVTEGQGTQRHFNSFPVWNSRKEMYLPARLGLDHILAEKVDVTCEDYEQRSYQIASSSDSDLNLISRSVNTCKKNDETGWNQSGKEMIQFRDDMDHALLTNNQPTMRLMGKDVALGRESFEMPLSGTNNGSSLDNFLTTAALPFCDSSTKVNLQQDPLLQPGRVEPKEAFARPFCNCCSLGTRSMKAPMAGLGKLQPNWQKEVDERLMNADHGSTLHKFYPPPTSPVFNQGYDESAHASWLRKYSTSLIPWPLHTAQQVTPSATQLFPEVHCRQQSHAAGLNFLNVPSMHHSPVVNNPWDPESSYLHIESLVGPTSKEQARNGTKIMFRERKKSEGVGAKGTDHISKNKRPASSEELLAKPIKIPQLAIRSWLEDRSNFTVQTLSSNSQGCLGPRDLSMDNHNCAGCAQDMAQTDEAADSLSIGYSDEARCGPMKLSAGARHLFKPKQNMDQSNSELIHSNIPFISLMDSGSLAGPQNKSKIYRF